MTECSEDIRWYTVSEASDYLRVTSATLYNYMKSGKLQFYYIAGTRQRRLKKSDLEALMIRGNPDEMSDEDDP